MGFLHSFTVTVLLVSFLCFFCEALSPEGTMGKYTALVTGLVVSLALVSAFLQIRSMDIGELTVPEATWQTAGDESVVEVQFAQALAEAVAQRVSDNLGIDIQVRAEVSCKDKVMTICNLYVTGNDADFAVLSAFISENFGIVPKQEAE